MRVNERVIEAILISFHNCAFDLRGLELPSSVSWLAWMKLED
jgi:hypothetical protein